MSHTNGQMRWEKRPDGSLYYVIGDHKTGSHAQGDIYIGEDDLRRLTACWNAFDGVDTEKIEGKTVAEYMAGEAYLTGMNVAKGWAELGLEGSACYLLASSFAGQFKGSGAINYLEVAMGHEEIGPFTVTIQRAEGETPAKQLHSAKVQRDELLAALKDLSDGFRTLKDSDFPALAKARAAIAKAEGTTP